MHYRAQKEMYYNLKGRSEDTNDKVQILICTHSIAMVDRAPAGIINYIDFENNLSVVSFLKGKDDVDIKDFLDSISEISGIKNSSLFFERCFLIVEGETEENFMPKAYQTVYNRRLSEDGIVLINLKGNAAWQSFLKLLNKNKADCTVLVLDKDCQTDKSKKITTDKLEQINFQAEFFEKNVFLIGENEFEEIFSNSLICKCLNTYWKKEANEQWSETEIAGLRGKLKFSDALVNLMSKYRNEHKNVYQNFGKPEFGARLGEMMSLIEVNSLTDIQNIFNKLKEIIK